MENIAAVVEGDLPCAICGYNLKGLSIDANCPECGQAVARTYSPDLPRSDRRWLRYQANTMLLLSTLCLVNFQPFVYALRQFQVWNVMGILVCVATVWACWRLAKPEPPGPPADGEATVQRALRLAPVIFAAIRIGSLVMGNLNQRVLTVVGITGLICLLLTNALVGWFVLRLARRSNDQPLILHARIVAWAFPLSQAYDLLFFFVGFIFSRSETSQTIFVNLFGVFNWLLAAATYYTLLLFGRMHETLRAAAKSSDAIGGRSASASISS